MIKKGHRIFKGRNRVIPPVTAPGDTNLSDAIVCQTQTQYSFYRAASMQGGHSHERNVRLFVCPSVCQTREL